jgi:hypothetical protein
MTNNRPGPGMDVIRGGGGEDSAIPAMTVVIV